MSGSQNETASSNNSDPSSKTIADAMRDLLEKYRDRLQAQSSAVVEPDWSRPPTLDIHLEERMKREDPEFQPPPRDHGPRRHLTDIRSAD